MNRWTVLMIAAAAALTQPALAQTSDGVPGDRVVVPLPDVSGCPTTRRRRWRATSRR